jgi:hypothetical protein
MGRPAHAKPHIRILSKTGYGRSSTEYTPYSQNNRHLRGRKRICAQFFLVFSQIRNIVASPRQSRPSRSAPCEKSCRGQFSDDVDRTAAGMQGAQGWRAVLIETVVTATPFSRHRHLLN